MTQLSANDLLIWRGDAGENDYRPIAADADDVAELEALFGDLLFTGHSVHEAAAFVIDYAHGRLAGEMPEESI